MMDRTMSVTVGDLHSHLSPEPEFSTQRFALEQAVQRPTLSLNWQNSEISSADAAVNRIAIRLRKKHTRIRNSNGLPIYLRSIRCFHPGKEGTLPPLQGQNEDFTVKKYIKSDIRARKH
jgi:hypothetical protein